MFSNVCWLRSSEFVSYNKLLSLFSCLMVRVTSGVAQDHQQVFNGLSPHPQWWLRKCVEWLWVTKVSGLDPLTARQSGYFIFQSTRGSCQAVPWFSHNGQSFRGVWLYSIFLFPGSFDIASTMSSNYAAEGHELIVNIYEYPGIGSRVLWNMFETFEGIL